MLELSRKLQLSESTAQKTQQNVITAVAVLAAVVDTVPPVDSDGLGATPTTVPVDEHSYDSTSGAQKATKR